VQLSRHPSDPATAPQPGDQPNNSGTVSALRSKT
jgi:hypothetical protein